MSETEYKPFQKIVLDCPDSTIVCDAHKHGISREYYQTEQAIENALLQLLERQGYERITVKGKRELINNLRRQLERLNSQRIPGFKFTDSEWNRFYAEHFQGPQNTGVENRTKLIQLGDCIVELKRDDGNICNITLFDKRRPQHNYVQVMNQFVDAEAKKRYDVTILINGLPMVQIELKNNGVKIKEAFQQIHRYREEAFSDLFEFIQIFVISNGTNTKYFSNTIKHKQPGSKSKSIQFAANWGYASGKPPIRSITDFAYTFLNKRVLLEVLAKYCVLDLKGNLKILRPYQIAAIERILCRINSSINMKLEKQEDAGGYIWHTTGSGKTLTSFKAAQLALSIPTVKKVLFVVDRKDLDSQTYAEYKSFLGDTEDQTIDNTKNTNALKELLNDEVPRIIVTTIQKLRRLLNEKDSLNENLKREKIVIISDECHRSQTGTIKDLLQKRFEAKSWFGFTGTPLLKNKEDGSIYDGSKITFGDQLHQYNIVNAIKDDKVLPFRIHPRHQEEPHDPDFSDNPIRIKSIVKYIIDSFDRLTNNRQLNSMFAVESIPMAIKYYQEFQNQQNHLKKEDKPLKVATIFSPFSPSKQDEDEQTYADTTTSEEEKKESLAKAMKGYNKIFNSDFSISDFNKYRESISEKTKNKEIDILIVVDMFLTGFDAPTLNTLWVDKNLKEHGLIQAFSRTNRILDKSKTHGNIVCFRNLKERIDEALLLFSLDQEDRQAAIIPGYEERMAKYKESEQILLQQFPLDKEIVGAQAEKEFMEAYGEFRKHLSSVMCEDKFESDREMTTEQHQDYKSIYVDLMNKYRNKCNTPNQDEANQADMPAFEEELLRTDEIDIDIDYIQRLIEEYKRKIKIDAAEAEKIRKNIMRVIGSSVVFSKEKEILERYLEDEEETLNYQDYKKKELEKEIDKLINEEGLQSEGTKEYIDKFVEDQRLDFSGPKIQGKIMPKMNKVDNSKEYKIMWNRVKNKIEGIFYKFNVEEYW